jgi:hypothetical protein
MPENRNISLLGNGSVNIPAKEIALNNRRGAFSVDSAAFVPTQRCGKHISTAVNRHAAIESGVFCGGLPEAIYS